MPGKIGVREMTLLGHVVSADGIRMSKERMPIPDAISRAPCALMAPEFEVVEWSGLHHHHHAPLRVVDGVARDVLFLMAVIIVLKGIMGSRLWNMSGRK